MSNQANDTIVENLFEMYSDIVNVKDIPEFVKDAIVQNVKNGDIEEAQEAMAWAVKQANRGRL